MVRVGVVGCVLAAGLGVWSGGVAAQDAGATQPVPAKRFSEAQVRNALNELLPGGVDVRELAVEGDRARLSGMATDTVQLSQLMRRLDDAPEFATPELESIANVGGQSEFIVNVQMSCADLGTQPSALCGNKPAAPRGPTVHKCKVNGTVTFQGTPCAPGQEG